MHHILNDKYLLLKTGTQRDRRENSYRENNFIENLLKNCSAWIWMGNISCLRTVGCFLSWSVSWNITYLQMLSFSSMPVLVYIAKQAAHFTLVQSCNTSVICLWFPVKKSSAMRKQTLYISTVTGKLLTASPRFFLCVCVDFSSTCGQKQYCRHKDLA